MRYFQRLLGMRQQLFVLGIVGAVVGVSAPAAQIASYVDNNGRRVYVNAEEAAKQGASKRKPKRKQRSRHSVLVRRDPYTNQLVTVPVPNESLESPESAKAAPKQPESAASPTGEDSQYDRGAAELVERPNLSTPMILDELIVSTAERHAVDPNLVRAIVKVESNFNPAAISRKGATGLMQLMPATARRFGVGNLFDPEENLDGGVRYLKHLLGMYAGNLPLSLAAYNAGENAVARYGGIPPYPETRRYIRKVSSLYSGRYALRPQRPVIMKWVDERGRMHFSNTQGW